MVSKKKTLRKKTLRKSKKIMRGATMLWQEGGSDLKQPTQTSLNKPEDISRKIIDISRKIIDQARIIKSAVDASIGNTVIQEGLLEELRERGVRKKKTLKKKRKKNKKQQSPEELLRPQQLLFSQGENIKIDIDEIIINSNKGKQIFNQIFKSSNVKNPTLHAHDAVVDNDKKKAYEYIINSINIKYMLVHFKKLVNQKVFLEEQLAEQAVAARTPQAAVPVKASGHIQKNIIYNNTVASRVLARALDEYIKLKNKQGAVYQEEAEPKPELNFKTVKTKVKFLLVWTNQDNKVVVSISEFSDPSQKNTANKMYSHPEIHFVSTTDKPGVESGKLDQLVFSDPLDLNKHKNFGELKDTYNLDVKYCGIFAFEKGNGLKLINGSVIQRTDADYGDEQFGFTPFEPSIAINISNDDLFQMNAESLADDFAFVIPPSVKSYKVLGLTKDDILLVKPLVDVKPEPLVDVKPDRTIKHKSYKVKKYNGNIFEIHQIRISNGTVEVIEDETSKTLFTYSEDLPDVKQKFITTIKAELGANTIKTPLPKQKDLVELLNNCYQGIIKKGEDPDILLTKFRSNYSSSDSSIFFAMRLYYKSEDEGQGTFISFYVSDKDPEEHQIIATEVTAFCQEVKVQLLNQISLLQESAKDAKKDLVLVKVNDVPKTEENPNGLQVEWERTLYKSEPSE